MKADRDGEVDRTRGTLPDASGLSRSNAAEAMLNGITLGLLAFALFSFGDASIKALRGSLSVFEIGLLATISAGAVLALHSRKVLCSLIDLSITSESCSARSVRASRNSTGIIVHNNTGRPVLLKRKVIAQSSLKKSLQPRVHTIPQSGTKSSIAALNCQVAGFGRSTMPRKYSKSTSKKVESAMHERKRGTLKSGRSGKKVTSRKQAIAIGLSEARREGKKVPKRRSSKKS